MDCGEKISSLRKANNMTQEQLGKQLNVSYQAVSKWERGESRPDFETMSRIARIFGVSLTYFEDDETAAANATVIPVAVPQPVPQPVPQSAPQSVPIQPKLLGVCSVCGKAVYGAAGRTVPKLVCKACCEKQRLDEEKKKAAHAKFAARRLHTGLTVAIFPAAALLIYGIIALAMGNTTAGIISLIAAPFAYTFMAQMFWRGAVLECAMCGGYIAKMPGIIFTFNPSGIIFLIVIKLLFMFIKIFIFLGTILLCVSAAAFISPFTFIPALSRVKRGDIDDFNNAM